MTSHLLRRLTSAGIDSFRAWLAEQREGAGGAPPWGLLSDSISSEPVDPSISFDSGRSFTSKVELGSYLVNVLSPLVKDRHIEMDRGLWTGLALTYFDSICPSVNGERKVGSDERYVLTASWDRVYRHLVRTPFVVSQIHGSCARVVLSGSPHKHGEATEQLLSRQDVLLNVPLWQALDRLYVLETGKLKTGMRGKDRGGTVRRLGKVLRQYDRTFDLYEMNPDQILDLLPHEFDRFKAA